MSNALYIPSEEPANATAIYYEETLTVHSPPRATSTMPWEESIPILMPNWDFGIDDYDGTVGYEVTDYTADLNARSAYIARQKELIRASMNQVDAALTKVRLFQNDFRNDHSVHNAPRSYHVARQLLQNEKAAFEAKWNFEYHGVPKGYNAQRRAEFQEEWLAGRALAPSGGNAFDSILNATTSITTGYGDAWSFGYTSQWQADLYGHDLNAFNQDSYFYSAGQIAGTATFAYASGAGFARANAALGGFTGYGALASQTGLFGYGAITLGYQANDTYSSWDNLSGSQRITAIGAPIAGLVGGYVGYRAVPTESLRSWSNAGAASRAQVNQFASAAWEHLATYRIELVPYNPNVFYSNPVPVKITRVPQPAKNGPFEASPALEGSNYHWKAVEQRQAQWRQHFGPQANRMNHDIYRGLAPRTVDRVDTPKFPNEKLHVHFEGEHALNIDGTWKHGGRSLTNSETEWLHSHNWPL